MPIDTRYNLWTMVLGLSVRQCAVLIILSEGPRTTSELAEVLNALGERYTGERRIGEGSVRRTCESCLRRGFLTEAPGGITAQWTVTVAGLKKAARLQERCNQQRWHLLNGLGEDRLKWIASRMGLRLVRSQARDPASWGYGRYCLEWRETGAPAFGADSDGTPCADLDDIGLYLDDIEAFLKVR